MKRKLIGENSGSHWLTVYSTSVCDWPLQQQQQQQKDVTDLPHCFSDVNGTVYVIDVVQDRHVRSIVI